MCDGGLLLRKSLLAVAFLTILAGRGNGAIVGKRNEDANRHEEAKCSACGVVAQELLITLDKEVKQSDPASKNRVEIASDGETVLNVAISESTMLDVIDSTCEKMKDYVLIENEAVPQFVRVDTLGQGSRSVSRVNQQGAGSQSESGGLRINNLAGGTGSIEMGGGGGFTELSGASLTLGGGDAAQAAWGGRRLERFCEELLGEHEDTVMSVLQSAPETIAQELCVEPSGAQASVGRSSSSSSSWPCSSSHGDPRVHVEEHPPKTAAPGTKKTAQPTPTPLPTAPVDRESPSGPLRDSVERVDAISSQRGTVRAGQPDETGKPKSLQVEKKKKKKKGTQKQKKDAKEPKRKKPRGHHGTISPGAVPGN